MTELDIAGTRITERGTEDAVRRLFEDDGTVYLVTGFFTANAYRELRDDLVSFPDRSADNELVLVVGAGADQFSPSIARALWRLDAADRVRIYKYRHGFFHAKLYVRRGPSPIVVVGSANLTRVAFEQTLEMSAVVRGETPDDPLVRPFLAWVDDLVDVCEPLRRRDLLTPVRFATTVVNWTNKARLLPVGCLVRSLPLRVQRLYTVRGGRIRRPDGRDARVRSRGDHRLVGRGRPQRRR